MKRTEPISSFSSSLLLLSCLAPLLRSAVSASSRLRFLLHPMCALLIPYTLGAPRYLFYPLIMQYPHTLAPILASGLTYLHTHFVSRSIWQQHTPPLQVAVHDMVKAPEPNRFVALYYPHNHALVPFPTTSFILFGIIPAPIKIGLLFVEPYSQLLIA